MKKVKFISISIIALLLVSCGANNVNFEYKRVKIDSKEVVADIVYPYFTSKNKEVADKINNEIGKLLIYDENDKSASLENQIIAMGKESLADTTNRDMQYSFIMKSKVTYYKGIVSVKIDKEDFVGGAHYNYYTSILNFDRNGDVISNDKLIVNNDEFLEVVRNSYYQIREITKNTSAEDAIMFVEPKELPLAQNIGIDSLGIIVYYNRYEVTPFYLGATEVVIPIQEASKFINPEYK